MSILDEIFAYKQTEVAEKLRVGSLEAVKLEALEAVPPLDFVAALQQCSDYSGHNSTPALIAEVKQASPSKGVFRSKFDALGLARIYQQNGAAAISVLTDELFFMGHLDNLRKIANGLDLKGSRLPLLRKDFIFHPYQVYEARTAGADAVLLITAWLQPDQLHSLCVLVEQLGMSALIEVHNEAELNIALACEPKLIGINNRDLKDFSVNLETTMQLRQLIPEQVCVISESGIHSKADIEYLSGANVDAILVGEALVTAVDIASKVRELAGLDLRVSG